MRRNKENGFGLIELLVVVIILGILAAIAIPIYNQQQAAAKDAATQQSLNYLYKAINAAKASTGKTLIAITGSTCNACTVYATSPITNAGPETDPLNKPKTDVSWVTYIAALQKISDASGMNVTNLVDGYGRPFVIDENENESGPTACNRDSFGAIREPYIGWGALQYSKPIPNYSKGCNP